MVMDIRERGVAGATIGEAWKKWEGQVINGEFPLSRYLGGSDESAVFLTARREGESQKAAIKLIPADSKNGQLQLSHWTQAARLSHPHLIRLFQSGRCRLLGVGLLYVVMEYADENLSQVLPYRPLTPAEARDMLEPVLDALAYLHGKGFVHGRMKPSNIMAVADQLKISSDSLCPVGEWHDDERKPSAYDPPEITTAGNSPAGDVWSLGMTVVEALTQYVAVWERSEPAEPILPQTLPVPFLDIAQHCLRRDPQRRWTVVDIAMRLQAMLPEAEPKMQTESQATIADEPQKTSTKWRYVLATVVGGVALAATLAGPRLLNRSSESPRAPAPAVTVEQAPTQSQVQPKPEPNRKAMETRESRPKDNDNNRVPSRTASPPSESRSVAPPDTTTGDTGESQVVSRVLPDVSQKSLGSIHGTVRVAVRVHVDPTGNVETADFDSPGPSQYFADHALQAAQRWKFKPPATDGQTVPNEWILRFEFTNTAVNAHAAKAAP
jgi:TonB family protein